MKRPTHVRHVVLGLTVLVYMITYMDRVVLSTATPEIRKEFGLSLVAMSSIVAAFRWSYALFQIPGGWLGDKMGPRRALTLIVTWWSIFTSLTAGAWSYTSMIVIRFLFGLGEAGAFPIATRSLSRWMLPGERGFAQGITHAGSRLGAAVTPVLVAFVIAKYGWRAAFLMFGGLGLAWAAVWFFYYRDTPEEHPGVNADERELILGGERRAPASSVVPWGKIFSSRNMWCIALMYFCYNYCLNVYIDWFPTYLREHRHFSLTQMGIYATLTLLAGMLGDTAGGWLSDVLLRRTGNVNRSRRLVAITGFVIAVAATLPATLMTDPQGSVYFSCLAFFGLELTVGVSWALPLDIGGDYSGSVAAVMNMFGNIGGALSPTVLALLVKWSGWDAAFLITAVLCAIAALFYFKIDASKRIVYSA